MGLIGAIFNNAGNVSVEKLRDKYGRLLIDGEEIECGFKLVRDVYLFTTYRLILIDVQGVTGKKVEMLSIPYKSISRFSVESAGHFDLDAELKIWIASAAEPAIDKTFTRLVDIYDVQRLLASHVITQGRH